MTKAEYLSWFDEVLQPREPTFRLIPDDKIDFRLTDHSFTLGQQLSHISGALAFFARVLRHEEVPYKSLREIMVANRRQPSVNVDDGIRYLRTGIAAMRRAIEELTDEQFAGAMLDTPQRGRTQYWRYCLFAMEHHIHHLMEVHICLRVLGVEVNTKSLYVG
jgi:uncharacterized damage-inducible protein DinB